MKRIGAHILVACGLFAQSTPSLEIRGIVQEIGIGAPVAGAEVTLMENTGATLAATITDSSGVFVFRPERFGNFEVVVHKSGYFGVTPGMPLDRSITESTGLMVTLDANRQKHEATYQLMRPGELTGRVLDEERNPVSGIPVAIEADFNPMGPVTVTTGADGSFTASRLTPGGYRVRLSPRSGGLPIITALASEEELKIIDEDQAISYWPGGLDRSSSSPIPVSPGSLSNIGAIEIRKTPYYRARVSLQSGCDPGEEWTVTVERISNDFLLDAIASSGRIACGKPVLIRRLRPGDYNIAVAGRTAWAYSRVSVQKENLDIALVPNPLVEIAGKISVPDGASLPQISLALALPVRGLQGGGRATIEKDGSFVIGGLPSLTHQIQFLSRDFNFYVKEIRYGRVIADGNITPVGDRSVQLEIELDTGAAVISGSVSGPRGYVLAAKLPFPAAQFAAEGSATFRTAAIDAQGKFRLTGLAPGDYRIIAVPSGPIDASRIQLLATRGEKITVARGDTRTLDLKLAQ